MDPYAVTSMIAETTILWNPWTLWPHSHHNLLPIQLSNFQEFLPTIQLGFSSSSSSSLPFMFSCKRETFTFFYFNLICFSNINNKVRILGKWVLWSFANKRNAVCGLILSLFHSNFLLCYNNYYIWKFNLIVSTIASNIYLFLFKEYIQLIKGC